MPPKERPVPFPNHHFAYGDENVSLVVKDDEKNLRLRSIGEKCKSKRTENGVEIDLPWGKVKDLFTGPSLKQRKFRNEDDKNLVEDVENAKAYHQKVILQTPPRTHINLKAFFAALGEITPGSRPSYTVVYLKIREILVKCLKYGSDLGWRDDAEESCKLPSIDALEAAMVYGSNEGFGTMPETLVENLQDAGLYFLIVSPEKRVIPTFWKTSVDELGWKQGRDYKTLQPHIVAPHPVVAEKDHIDTIQPLIAQLDNFEQESLSFFTEVRNKMHQMQTTMDGLRVENQMLREELAYERDSVRTPRTTKASKQRQSFVLPNDVLPKEHESAQVSPFVGTGAIPFPAETRVTATPLRTAREESTGFRLPAGFLENEAHPTRVEDSTKRKSLADLEDPPGESKRNKPSRGRFTYRLWDDDDDDNDE